MAITGTHMLFYTSEADRLRAMLRDVLGFKHVDVGGGWLIFRLPPGEIGVHPNEGPTYESGVRHQITFMCDRIDTTIAELRAKGVDVDTATKDEGWGITSMIHLPGGCDVMLYEPRHPVVADIRTRKKTVKKTVRLRPKATARPQRRKTTTARRGRRATKAPRRR
jgi:hypothetical protein